MRFIWKYIVRLFSFFFPSKKKVITKSVPVEPYKEEVHGAKRMNRTVKMRTRRKQAKAAQKARRLTYKVRRAA